MMKIYSSFMPLEIGATEVIRQAILGWLLAWTLSACSVHLLSPYDRVIDQGVQSYKRDVNVFIRDTGARAGRPEGSYGAALDRYTRLEVQIDLLIDRAKLLQEGIECRLDEALAQRVGQAVLASAGLGESAQSGPASYGCTAKLLENVKKQLGLMRGMHAMAETCAWPGKSELTCIRPATVATLLKTTNQAIDAVLVVEMAKQRAGER